MSIERSVRSLSLRDVLDARDAYHVHLLHTPNVVATAVGRYLKRRDESDRSLNRTGWVAQATKDLRNLGVDIACCSRFKEAIPYRSHKNFTYSSRVSVPVENSPVCAG